MESFSGHPPIRGTEGGGMTDDPRDRSDGGLSEGSRSEEPLRTGRTGPLGDDGSGEEARASGDAEETRQIPADETRRGGSLPRDASNEETRLDNETGGEEKETRVIRTPGSERRSDRRTANRGGDTGAYPRGYFEAAEEREDRLTDMYGGVDWLASFLGFVFAAVAGGVLFSILSLVLVPLGVSVQIGGELGPAAITALALLAVLIFLTFLFGGYVAGRLARFDGGRNGAMSVVWTLIIGFLGFVIASFFPGPPGDAMRDFIQGTAMPLAGEVLDLGAVGIAVAVAAVLIAVLGGIAGGRLGGRYHAEIDRTT